MGSEREEAPESDTEPNRSKQAQPRGINHKLYTYDLKERTMQVFTLKSKGQRLEETIVSCPCSAIDVLELVWRTLPLLNNIFTDN